jgi:hypothetical protein
LASGAAPAPPHRGQKKLQASYISIYWTCRRGAIFSPSRTTIALSADPGSAPVYVLTVTAPRQDRDSAATWHRAQTLRAWNIALVTVRRAQRHSAGRGTVGQAVTSVLPSAGQGPSGLARDRAGRQVDVHLPPGAPYRGGRSRRAGLHFLGPSHRPGRGGDRHRAACRARSHPTDRPATRAARPGTKCSGRVSRPPVRAAPCAVTQRRLTPANPGVYLT